MLATLTTLQATVRSRITLDNKKGVHLSPLGFAACQSKKCTNQFVTFTHKGVHLYPLGFAACQSKKCTNQVECIKLLGWCSGDRCTPF